MGDSGCRCGGDEWWRWGNRKGKGKGIGKGNGNGNGIGWAEGLYSHLGRGEAAPKMGHPVFLGRVDMCVDNYIGSR